MKRWQQVAFGLIAVFGGLVFSTIITLAVWNIQIEGRAFQCNDGPGLGAFWADVDTHRGAGDTISPGWTWEKLKIVRIDYEIAFYSLWSLTSIGAFLAVLQISKRVARETIFPRPVAGEGVESDAAV
jgi:hypothetical protein